MPLIRTITTAGGSRLGLWHIQEPEEVLREQLQASPDVEEELQALSHPPRRVEWLASRLLLQHLHGQMPLHLTKDEQGKPHLNGSSSCCSITHGGGWAAAAVGPQPLGTDLEVVREQILRIAPRFAHEEERAWVPSLQHPHYLTVMWCAKEAIFKLWGRGSVTFREDIRLEPFRLQDGLLHARFRRGSDWQEYVIHFCPLGEAAYWAWVEAG